VRGDTDVPRHRTVPPRPPATQPSLIRPVDGTAHQRCIGPSADW
jgi:hypothetical protein